MNGIASVARVPEHLDVFWPGDDGRIWSSWWHAGLPWSGAFSIGGFFPAHAPIAAVARMPNHLDVFVVGNDGRVYTSWWHEGQPWSGAADSWTPIGGFFPPGASICAVSRNPDHLDVFVMGNDGRVYTSWWHHGQAWSGRQRQLDVARRVLPDHRVARRRSAVAPTTSTCSSPATTAASTRAGGTRGRRGRASTTTGRRSAGSSRPATTCRPSPGCPSTSTCSSPATTAASTRAGGTTGRRGRASTTTGRRSAGSSRPTPPVASVSRNPDHLDLFITGNDGRVYTSWWHDGQAWSGVNDNWASARRVLPAGRAARRRSPARPDHLDLFLRGNDGLIYSSWWHEGQPWSGVNDNWFTINTRPGPRLDLHTIDVRDAQEDGILSDGDEPYIVTLGFRSKFRTPGSTTVFWGHDLHELGDLDEGDSAGIPRQRRPRRVPRRAHHEPGRPRPPRDARGVRRDGARARERRHPLRRDRRPRRTDPRRACRTS